MTDECPGAGKCHGCMRWCDNCADTDGCEFPTCQQHHCYSCKQLLAHDDRDGYTSLCRTCSIASINDDQIKEFERAFAHGDLNHAEQIARDLAANPVPGAGVHVGWYDWNSRKAFAR